MLARCASCVLPIELGVSWIICSVGCGNVVHSSCCVTSVTEDTRFAPCGSCKVKADSSEGLAEPLCKLQEENLDQRATVLKLQNTVDRLVEKILSSGSAEDTPPAARSTPIVPEALNDGSRKVRKARKKQRTAPLSDVDRPPSVEPVLREGTPEEAAVDGEEPKPEQGAAKRGRDAADLSESFERSARESSLMEVAGAPLGIPHESQPVAQSREDGGNEEQQPETAKKRKKPPVKIRSGTSDAAEDNLEFITREPIFHALYVDGMSKKTTAAQVLQWFKKRDVLPFAVWKVKNKGADSAFCVGLRPKHLKTCSNPDFYPQQMRYRRWIGRPPSPQTVIQHVEEKPSETKKELKQ